MSAFSIFHRFPFVVLTSAILFGLITEKGMADAADKNNEQGAHPILVRQRDELIVPANSPLRPRLVISPVKEQDFPHTITLPGVVEADPSRIVNIIPPLTGRLTELKVNLGDTIEKGQLLAIIQSPDLDQAFADLDKARDAFELATKALDRARLVRDIGANAVKELEQINSNYEQAQVEFKRTEARFKTLIGSNGDINSRMLNINAPISGTITALNVGQGSYINDATAPLMTITNLDNIWVTANVPENLLSSVVKGQAVDVNLFAYPDQKFHGTITFTSVLLDPDTHRNKARIDFTNPDGKLKPNMYATVSIEVPQAKLILVPLSALLMNNDTTTVFVEVAPWTFVRHVVVLGNEDDENARILSGLKAGDRVVIRGGVLLND